MQNHMVKTLYKHRCFKWLYHPFFVPVCLHVRLLWEDNGGEQMGRHRWMTTVSSLVGAPSHLLLDDMCSLPTLLDWYWRLHWSMLNLLGTIKCSLMLQPPDAMSTFIHTLLLSSLDIMRVKNVQALDSKTHSFSLLGTCLSHATNCCVKILDLYFVTCFTGADAVHAVVTVCVCIHITINYITFIGCAIICTATWNGIVI